MGAGWGELKVELCVTLTQTVLGLAGEVGCVRGQALPCTEGGRGSSRRIFPEKKKTLWGTLGNSPAAKAPVSSPPRHPSGDCAHLISEGAENTGTWEIANQGRLCTHTHSSENAYHKKIVGRSWKHQDSSWKRKPTKKGNSNR